MTTDGAGEGRQSFLWEKRRRFRALPGASKVFVFWLFGRAVSLENERIRTFRPGAYIARNPRRPKPEKRGLWHFSMKKEPAIFSQNNSKHLSLLSEICPGWRGRQKKKGQAMEFNRLSDFV
ncbi:MAG: hypothetical protein D6714_16845 [Bacteroidetes bacterium]|nr:MAG: hypothetical protein D6714_16845 [Bacteroidota bacterium]